MGSRPRVAIAGHVQMIKMKSLQRIGLYVIVIAGAAISVVPFLTMIFVSLKPAKGLFETPMWFPPLNPTLDNFVALFEGSSSFASYFVTTIAVVVAVTTGQVIFSTLAAYAFARMRFRGRDILFWAYLATLMIPNVVTLIPLFLVMKQLGLVSTILGIALPYIFGTPFGIFLARQFFLGIPSDLVEAGRLDGLNDWGIFWRIIIPISRPIIVTLIIITAVQSWNNFLWPLIIGGTPGTTVLTVGIANLSGAVTPAYGPMMAAAVLIVVPILVVFILFQRQIVSSIQLSGMK